TPFLPDCDRRYNEGLEALASPPGWAGIALGRAARRRRRNAKARAEARQVPPAESIDQPFREGRVGPGLVGWARDARMRALDERPILAVGRGPYRAQAVDLVVDAFLGVLVHQPPGAQQRPVGRQWQHREADDVIAHEVVPGVRLRPHRQSPERRLR